MITLQVFSSLPEAHTVKSLLEAHNITTYLKTDDQGGLRPSLQLTSGIELMILASDLNKAKDVLSTRQGESPGVRLT